ncbi:MAG: hypothetical protein IKD75_15540 [Prevotella sp.]|nr:hypothetical protein [Prevotella sp.]
MTNSSLICWPRGNDVSLTIYLYEPQVDANGIPVRDQQGNIVWEPVDVDAYDEWRVRVKTDEYILLSSAAGATAGTLVVKVPGTFPCGVYAVEFTGMKNGFAVRSFETTMFGIVESNGDANVTFDIVDGERSCDIDIKIQMVPFSVERGKNAYELWKEQPGNEDKTLQDYLDSLEPVQADWTETDPDDKAFIKHKPTLAAVATSGDYGDLLNKPITTLERGTNLDTITESGLYYVTGFPDSLLVVFTPYTGYTRQCLVTGEGELKSRVQSHGQWSTWSETYYIKPSGGIPKSDLASAVRTSLNKADSALQSQVQSDWDETNTNSPAYIKHKPTSFAQEQADWNETDTTAPDYIKNKPTLAAVATSGDYNDLLNKPITTLGNVTNLDTITRKGLYYVTEYPDSLLVVFTPYPNNTCQCLVTGEGKLKFRVQSNGTWSTWSETYYIKPSGGIPKSDLASAVQTSLNKADTALQSFTETDPTVQAWAKTGIRYGNNVLTPATLGFLSSLFDLDMSQGNLTIQLKTGDATPIIITGIVSSNDNSGWEHAGNGALPTVGLVYNKVTAKYTKPSGGIPKTDLASAVQTSLNNADSAIALIGDINTILDEINGEVI